MQRFKKYIDKALKLENVKNSDQLTIFEVTCRYLPDPLEDFDEIEISTDFAGEEVLIGIAVQTGKLKRIMFSLTDKEDPDIFRGLTESQLRDLLNRKGEQIVNFFEYITQ